MFELFDNRKDIEDQIFESGSNHQIFDLESVESRISNLEHRTSNWNVLSNYLIFLFRMILTFVEQLMLMNQRIDHRANNV